MRELVFAVLANAAPCRWALNRQNTVRERHHRSGGLQGTDEGYVRNIGAEEGHRAHIAS
jgi:hypothetical protein